MLEQKDYKYTADCLLNLININYDINIDCLKLIDSHFGTEIYLAEESGKPYIVKVLPLYVEHIENEGYLTEFLFNNGISVARLIKTINDEYHVKTDKIQFHVQEFIYGQTLKVNTAPDWFLWQSAQLLGEIHNVLNKYNNLHVCFGSDFFEHFNFTELKNEFEKQLHKNTRNHKLECKLSDRLKHLNRIAGFNIDTRQLTYANSHGDFHIGQIITHNKNLCVIDWTSACKLPICLEIISSYVSSDPQCENGVFNIDRLKKYIDNYGKHYSINNYDLKMMPYVLYFKQIICHYSPPYSAVPSTYAPYCQMIIKFTDWLYENVEDFSERLIK